jgi:hypothetical protein
LVNAILACLVCSAFAGTGAVGTEQNIAPSERTGGDGAEGCPACAPKTGASAPHDTGGAGGSQKPRVLEVFGGTPLRLVEDGPGRFSVDRIVGKAGTTFPVKVHLPSLLQTNPDTKAAYTFLMFRGIPDGMSLSSGFRTANAWMVSINEIESLALYVPPKFQGDFPIDILFYNGEAASPAKLSVFIHVLSAKEGGGASLPALPPPATQERQALAHRTFGISKTEEDNLLHQAEQQLQNGNIVFARLLFEQLAAHGSAQGAFAMAQTYDPTVLEQIGAIGVRGDVELAKYWYRKAAELGNVPVSDMISAMKKDRQ